MHVICKCQQLPVHGKNENTFIEIKIQHKRTYRSSSEENEEMHSCRRAVGRTRMSKETFKTRIGHRVISYCEEQPSVWKVLALTC